MDTLNDNHQENIIGFKLGHFNGDVKIKVNDTEHNIKFYQHLRTGEFIGFNSKTLEAEDYTAAKKICEGLINDYKIEHNITDINANTKNIAPVNKIKPR